MWDPPTIPLRIPPVGAISETIAREHQMLGRRIAQVGQWYEKMEAFLEGAAAETRQRCTHKYLLCLADYVIRVWGCPAVDRMAQRRKPALICWFCEKCPFLLSFSVMWPGNPLSPDRPASRIDAAPSPERIPVPSVPIPAPLGPIAGPSEPKRAILNWRDFDDSGDLWDLMK
jgi:hypothetical protein